MANSEASGPEDPSNPASRRERRGGSGAAAAMSQGNQVVFAITSQGHDFYAAMTRVAIASLRLSNPALRVVVAADGETDRAVRQARDPLIGEVDEWLAVDTPPGIAGFRNRFVKTSLRGLIEGPYIFLDSDVFVRGNLSEIFTLDADIAGARNHSQQDFAEQVWEQDAVMLRTMGWMTRTDVYINGGVLFLNDTIPATRLASEWHRRWLRSFQFSGKYRDQPALNSAIFATRPRLTVLPDRYNAQVKTNTRVAADADLWHFYADSQMPGFFQYDVVVKKLLRTRTLDLSEIQNLRQRREPWRDEILGDRYVANRLSRQGCPSGWELIWLSGQRFHGLLSCIRGRRP